MTKTGKLTTLKLNKGSPQKNTLSWELSHTKFRLSVWVLDKEETYYPTLYTIDVLNNYITFDYLGHTYTEPLTHVNMKTKKKS